MLMMLGSISQSSSALLVNITFNEGIINNDINEFKVIEFNDEINSTTQDFFLEVFYH